jgi:acetolactate synthase-1/2/3 large subunit
MQLSGAEIVIECLKEQGVDTVFGYPGGAILNVYDALYQHKNEIRHVLTSHEQGASHAADGYARSTGKVGVCVATSGPGATNLVTGIATAYMDSVPIVAITCNVTVPLLGQDSFQEVDIAGVTMPVTKHNFIVKDVHKLAETLRRAFKIAQSGRPGPVLVDITKDATGNKCEYKPADQDKKHHTINASDLKKSQETGVEAIEEMIHRIKRCKRPFIFVGGGAVISGETPLQAAVRELFEETGLKALPEALDYRGQIVHKSERHNHINIFYLFRADFHQDSIVLQPGETDAARLVFPAEIERMAKEGEFVSFCYQRAKAMYPDIFGERMP